MNLDEIDQKSDHYQERYQDANYGSLGTAFDYVKYFVLQNHWVVETASCGTRSSTQTSFDYDQLALVHIEVDQIHLAVALHQTCSLIVILDKSLVDVESLVKPVMTPCEDLNMQVEMEMEMEIVGL